MSRPKAFRKQTIHVDEVDDKLEELEADNKKYREHLNNLEMHLFELQKEALPQPKPFRAKNNIPIREGIASMGSKLNTTRKQTELKTSLAEMLKDFGLAVDLITDKLCTVKFNVTNKNQHIADYAVQLIRKDGDAWEVKKYHLPSCFPLETLESRAETMSIEYFGLMQDGLYAYHERLLQRIELQNSVPNYVTIMPNVSGTVVEIIFKMANQESLDNETLCIVLTVFYDPFQSRPYRYEISQNTVIDAQSHEMIEIKEQFAPMLSYRLTEAFFRSAGKCNENKFYCLTDEDYVGVLSTKYRVPERFIEEQDSVTDQSSEENAQVKSRKTVQRNGQKNTREQIQENQHSNEQNSEYAESQVYDPMEDESFIRITRGAKKAVSKTTVMNKRKQPNMSTSLASSDDQNSSRIRPTRARKPKYR